MRSTTTPTNMTDYQQFGYVKDGDIYLKAYLEFEDRKIGVVKEDETASVQYFIDRFERVKQKIADVEAAIYESANKGSYLMKLIHMRTYLATYNGIGDFAALYQKIDDLETHINEYIADNRVKNTQIKQALLQEAQALEGSTQWDETADILKDLKMRWIRTGSADKAQEDELCQKFDAILDDFFARRKAFFDNEREESNRRMNQYYGYLRELRRINRSPKKDEFKTRVVEIQKAWKEIGQINKWKYLKIWKQYKYEVDIYFGNPATPPSPPYHQRGRYGSGGHSNYGHRGDRDQRGGGRSSSYMSGNQDNSNDESGGRKRIRRSMSSSSYSGQSSYNPKPQDGNVNLDRKRELCEEVESITSKMNDVALSEIKKLQMEFKSLGMIQNDLTDKDLNNRFRSACNEIFEHNSLLKYARIRYEGFDTKTQFEQLKIKIKMLKEAIKIEETELAHMPNPNQNPYADNKERLNYINKVNKIKTQKRMLRKFQQELTKNYY